MFERFFDLMHRGGPVMWLLLLMSIISLTLIFERAWFWLKTNGPGKMARVAKMEQMLRKGDFASARVLAEDDTSVYGRVVKLLLEEGYSDAVAAAAVESQRPRFERYMGMLSTMVTAGPLVGLLGSVIGLIAVFLGFSKEAAAAGANTVGQGMAEALMNTAGGLMIAVVVIFPYNAYRVQIDRTIGRLESILAAASKSATPAPLAKVAEAEPTRAG